MEREMNFSRYMSSLHTALPLNTSKHRQLRRGGPTLLVICSCHGQGHDTFPNIQSLAQTSSSYITPFLGNWKDNSTKLPEEGFPRQCYRTTWQYHDYILIETIRCDSVIWCPDFLETSFPELTLKNASTRFDKARALIKAYLSEIL